MRTTKSALVVVMVAVAFTGCRNRETPLTGSYGSNVVSGQVVMATGSSPEGVEASVSGTGMVVTVGEDGRFAFLGVPASAVLQFRRADDGIDARLRVDPSSGPIVVELSRAGARGRRRGAGRSLDYEGLIRMIEEGKLTLFTSHKVEVEIALTETTRIRKGQRDVPVEDLQVGWRVHVKAYTVDDVLTAREVIIQNTGEDDDGDDGEGAQTVTANGVVSAKDGSDLTVTTVPHGDVTVRTDENTIIKRQGERLTVDQIEVGWEINSQGTRVDETTILARQIEVRGKSKKP